MKYLKLWVLLIPIFVVISCKKEELEHPELKTIEIVALSPVKVRVTGEIVHTGTHKIFDYGFIYGTSSYLSAENGTKVSLGVDVAEGKLTKDISITSLNNNLEKTIYARVYLTNDKGTAYGDIISVQLPGISVSGVSPSSGKTGDLITINGSFSNLTTDDVTVTFGNANALISSISSTKLIVKVPSEIITSSNNTVSVNVYLKGLSTANNGYYTFTVIPTILDYSPKSGTINSTLIISAQNLPENLYYNSLRVYFGTVQATISSLTRNSISVMVPEVLNEDKPVISVEYNGVKTIVSGNFTVTPHTITSLSPDSGLPGATFLINGSNMAISSYYSTNAIVKIGTIQVYPTVISIDQLRAAIPESLAPGNYDVTIKYGPHTVKAPQQLKVESIAASSFSPSSGGASKEVTIQGKFTANQSYQVYFGSVATYASSVTATTLKVYVPVSASYGVNKITIKSAAQSVEVPGDFTVLAPAITSFSPSSGVAGTVVTINGAGFSIGTFNNTVRFGTISTNIITATESTITAVVPSNLSPGAMKITVISNGQTIVSSTNFTITN